MPEADSPSRLGRAGRPQPCPVEAASRAERWRALGGSAGFCARSEEWRTPTGLSDGGTAPVSDSSLSQVMRGCVWGRVLISYTQERSLKYLTARRSTKKMLNAENKGGFNERVLAHGLLNLRLHRSADAGCFSLKGALAKLPLPRKSRAAEKLKMASRSVYEKRALKLSCGKAGPPTPASPVAHGPFSPPGRYRPAAASAPSPAPGVPENDGGRRTRAPPTTPLLRMCCRRCRPGARRLAGHGGTSVPFAAFRTACEGATAPR